MSVDQVAQILTALGGLGGAAGLISAFGARRARTYAAEAEEAADGAGSSAGEATKYRTDVLLDLVVEAERGRARLENQIWQCETGSCPVRTRLIQERPA